MGFFISGSVDNMEVSSVWSGVYAGSSPVYPTNCNGPLLIHRGQPSLELDFFGSVVQWSGCWIVNPEVAGSNPVATADVSLGGDGVPTGIGRGSVVRIHQ